MKTSALLRAVVGSLGLLVSSLRADSVVTDWNADFLQAVRESKMGPPMVARAAAVVHTCIYDAWACYDAKAKGTVYGDLLRRPEEERFRQNREQAIHFAAYRALVNLFPAQKAIFDQRMAEAGLDPLVATTNIVTPAGVGNLTSSAVLALRRVDGANQFGEINGGATYSDYTGYAPVNTVDQIINPNRWQPLRFVNPNSPNGISIPTFLAPHWGNVKPFALTSGRQLRPIPPALWPRDADRYRAQADYIVRVTSRLTDRQKVIAEYWADGPASETPPGHWNLFAREVSIERSFDLEKDVKLFFALGNALMDASIACWECKRHFDYVRPITAIRFLKRGRYIPTWGGTKLQPRTVLGENWVPYQPDTFVTPPFAEYTSGHSAFSASAAHVLRRFTGSDRFGHSVTIFAGASHIEDGVPATDITLSWPTFSTAANEAGVSRRYGGIHFPQGDIASRVLGRKIGAAVWAKCQRLFGVPRPVVVTPVSN